MAGLMEVYGCELLNNKSDLKEAKDLVEAAQVHLSGVTYQK